MQMNQIFQSLITSLLILAAGGSILPAQVTTATQDKVKLRQGRAQSEAAAKEELQGVIKQTPDLKAWKDRSERIKRGILLGAKLETLPERTPLNPVYKSKRNYDGYTAQNVAIESSPGFYVTGTLYRPCLLYTSDAADE